MSSGFTPHRTPAHHRPQTNTVCNHNNRACDCGRHDPLTTSTNRSATSAHRPRTLLSPLPDFVIGSSRGPYHHSTSHYERVREGRPQRGDSQNAVDSYYRGPTSASAPIPIPIPRRRSPSTNRTNAYGLLDGYTSNNTYGMGTVSYNLPSLTPSTSSASTVSSFGMPVTPSTPPQIALSHSSGDKNPDVDDVDDQMEESYNDIFDHRDDVGRDHGLDVGANGRPWEVQPPPAPRLRTIPLPPVKPIFRPRR